MNVNWRDELIVKFGRRVHHAFDGDRRSGQRQVTEAATARLGREARKWNVADIIKTVRTNR